MITEFVARVLHTRDAAHLAHWAAKGKGSYAEHTALDSFYGDLLGTLDEIVEVYQGGAGLIGKLTFPAERPDIGKIADHIRNEALWLAQNRDAIANGLPSVANLLDELHGTYLRAAYKLRFLE